MAATEVSEVMDRWRYAVALAKFIVHVLHPGIPRSLSVLIPSMVYQLELDYATIGFFITLEAGMMYLACPVSNCLSQKFSSRLVATVGGFLAGISLLAAFFSQTVTSLGCSFFFTGLFASPLRQISAETLKQHFGDKFGMAETVTHVGSQLGSFLLPYLTVICLDAYGMRGAFLFLSALMFHGVPIGATMRPPRLHSRTEQNIDDSKHDNDDDYELRMIDGSNVDDCKSDEDSSNEEMDIKAMPFIKKRKSSNRATTNTEESSEETKRVQLTWSVIRDYIRLTFKASFVKNERVFMFLLLPCQFLFDVSYSSWAYFSVSYGVSVGLSEERAVYLLMTGSVGGIIGRFVLIAVLYKYPLLTPQAFATNAGIVSVALLAYPVSSSLTYLMICSFFAGFGFYNSFSSYYGVVSLKVQKKNFAKAMSCSLMQSGAACLLSGILTGFLYNLFRSYPDIFRILGIFMAIDCLAMATFLCVESQSKQGKCWRTCS